MADALLSPAVGLTMCALSVAAIGISVASVRKDEFSEKKIPIMGVAGAMVFAAQMINFSIPGTGASGHIGGGILLAGLLGGIPAFLSITAVLIIQCLFFADGGLLALGANIFNLGVIPCFVVYPVFFKPIMQDGAGIKRLSTASIVSAVAALELGAFCVVIQTLLSGITELPFRVFGALMLPIHIVIGLVEGVVTAAVLGFVHKTRPEIIETSLTGERLGGVSIKNVLIALAALTVVIGGALSLFASSKPDGLEWAIGKTIEKTGVTEAGIADTGAVHDGASGIQDSTAIMPDYAFSSDHGGAAATEAAGTSVAGLVGALISFALAGAAGLAISIVKRARKRKREIV